MFSVTARGNRGDVDAKPPQEALALPEWNVEDDSHGVEDRVPAVSADFVDAEHLRPKAVVLRRRRPTSAVLRLRPGGVALVLEAQLVPRGSQDDVLGGVVERVEVLVEDDLPRRDRSAVLLPPPPRVGHPASLRRAVHPDLHHPLVERLSSVRLPTYDDGPHRHGVLAASLGGGDAHGAVGIPNGLPHRVLRPPPSIRGILGRSRDAARRRRPRQVPHQMISSPLGV